MRKSQALPARYPPSGVWPAQMRADMAAAYLDFSNTAELVAAIKRGDAPVPSSLRGKGRKREPVWSRIDLDRHIAPLSPRLQDDRVRENLPSLL
jgi:hypothetical protein